MTDAFEARGRALEDQFFHKKDQQLLEKFRQSLAAKDDKQALAAASGLSDEHLLDTLVSMNIRAETLAAIALVPLVAVAWADGKMDEGERKAILEAAAERGMVEGTAGFDLIQAWMSHKPGDEFIDAWKEYIHALKETLDAVAFDKLKAEVLGQAAHVAESAGGILGLVNRVSAIEKAKLEELEKAF